jgi:TonB family protein
VKYKILIKKSSNPQSVAKVAEEIARWSGNTVEAVQNALSQKSVCIKREADESEAMRLKQHFESVGAIVELVPLEATGAAEQKVPYQRDDDDDDDDVPGRILSDQEYSEALKNRNDIFVIDKDNRLKVIETVCLVFGVFFGVWLSTIEIMKVDSDFYEKMPEERTAKLVKTSEVEQSLEDARKKQKEEEEQRKQQDIQTEKKKLTPSKYKGAGGTSGGGGDPRARVTRKGVLGIISGKVTGKYVAGADIFGKGGFATGIDAILSGVGGLAGGGGGGAGRKGEAGIGYGVGYGSGFGGGSGGVDDLIGSLMGGGDEGSLALKKRGGELKVSAPQFVSGGSLTGGRSKASIMRVVMQNLAALRYAYNKRLREKPGLQGKVTVKFAIDEFGKVIFCEVVQSTMGDPNFEEIVVSKIKRWVFEKIDKPGDVTEVVYPFVFTQ